MHESGCSALIPDNQLSRCLQERSLDLYFRLKLCKELADADIEGLETCPGCPFAVVVDNPEEKLLYCLNEACKQVSCRKCRQMVCHSAFMMTLLT